MKNIYVLLSLALLGLAGCHKAEPVQTVDWFRIHTPERQAKLSDCAQNPGELEKTPNCVNAKRAAWLEDSHSNAPDLGKPVTRVKSSKEILEGK